MGFIHCEEKYSTRFTDRKDIQLGMSPSDSSVYIHYGCVWFVS
jgi:hypothetical protein